VSWYQNEPHGSLLSFGHADSTGALRERPLLVVHLEAVLLQQLSYSLSHVTNNLGPKALEDADAQSSLSNVVRES